MVGSNTLKSTIENYIGRKTYKQTKKSDKTKILRVTEILKISLLLPNKLYKFFHETGDKVGILNNIFNSFLISMSPYNFILCQV